MHLSPVLYTLTLWAPTPENSQTYSNNSSADSRRFVCVCLTISWGWRLKGSLEKSWHVNNNYKRVKRTECRSQFGIFLKSTYVEHEKLCKAGQKVNKEFVRRYLLPMRDCCIFQTCTLFCCLISYLTFIGFNQKSLVLFPVVVCSFWLINTSGKVNVMLHLAFWFKYMFNFSGVHLRKNVYYLRQILLNLANTKKMYFTSI